MKKINISLTYAAYLTPFHCWSSQHKFRRMEMPLKLDYGALILVIIPNHWN